MSNAERETFGGYTVLTPGNNSFTVEVPRVEVLGNIQVKNGGILIVNIDGLMSVEEAQAIYESLGKAIERATIVRTEWETNRKQFDKDKAANVQKNLRLKKPFSAKLNEYGQAEITFEGAEPIIISPTPTKKESK